MEKMRDQYDLIKANAERIRKTRSVYGDLIDFAENLLYLLVKMERDVTVSIPEFSDGILRTKLEEGFPLFNRWDFPVDRTVAKHVLEKVGEKIPSQNKELKRSVLKIRQNCLLETERKNIAGIFEFVKGS